AEINVPFSPETSASGIGNTEFYLAVWYRRQFKAPELRPGQRVILHFEAVDYDTVVWINGIPAGHHEGGYTRFSFDITDHLQQSDMQTLEVRVLDDPHDLAKPRGKQDWQLEP